MAQQHEWLREKVGQLEQKIETQQEKIDRAIKDEDSQSLINSYKEMMARLVEEKKDIYQQLSALASPALLNGTYRLQGAVADLYDGTIKTGQHFFNAAGKPNWVIFDSATGAVQGTVVGAIKARATVQKQANDGGFGSVDALLIAASNGTGLSGLPAYTDKIPNYPLAIPYQSGYVFLTGGQPNKEGGR
ncbi:hypothetical protein COCSUDRAFT_61966 [Coccomyxa subellipsoidea C-169]|uniref:Uncharacterized protein n=1 Tax=Coccomyxa subellipsoidea (strain C-169) TaxID=574566 RepID=I0Z1L7_COCSC|nr:hypothetical protein COCSUDRAFT_61966 [Coccomyxa subellipsoidea C-169]EIE24536.1 hypothetical protein COCSUDRAFT_61966 [Coccomyxa subellipsoidea C-169]|eukprot:XP_005649080.1 hypothetical protein COCSUDRAFT_61966 [Coccomyxa subellipsoidea C-169]